MFEVSIEHTFSAGHALRHYKGKCENVHGHNYRVQVVLRGEKLDSAGLLALLKQYGVELVLHGHDHIHSTMWFDGPANKIPAVGVPSASALAHGRYPAAAYNLFAIARAGDAWRCEQTVRGLDDAWRVREIRQTRLI